MNGVNSIDAPQWRQWKVLTSSSFQDRSDVSFGDAGATVDVEGVGDGRGHGLASHLMQAGHEMRMSVPAPWL